jgi:hypothetical protein
MFPPLDSIYYVPKAPMDGSRPGATELYHLVIWSIQLAWSILAILLLYYAMTHLAGWKKRVVAVMPYLMLLVVLWFFWTAFGVKLGPYRPGNPYNLTAQGRIEFQETTLPTRWMLLALVTTHIAFWAKKR